MTPEQFYDLDEQEQAKVVWDGKYFGDRQDAQHNIILYKIGDLYVEAYYNRQSNSLRKFMAYKEHELLDIYLPKN